jgi:hypothetical protein
MLAEETVDVAPQSFQTPAPVQLEAVSRQEDEPAAPQQFEIEDVLDAGDSESMFDLSGMFVVDPIIDVAPVRASAPASETPATSSRESLLVREPISLFERAPLALRDEVDAGRVDELREWLNRVRDRRHESVQYMAG